MPSIRIIADTNTYDTLGDEKLAIAKKIAEMAQNIMSDRHPDEIEVYWPWPFAKRFSVNTLPLTVEIWASGLSEEASLLLRIAVLSVLAEHPAIPDETSCGAWINPPDKDGWTQFKIGRREKGQCHFIGPKSYFSSSDEDLVFVLYAPDCDSNAEEPRWNLGIRKSYGGYDEESYEILIFKCGEVILPIEIWRVLCIYWAFNEVDESSILDWVETADTAYRSRKTIPTK